ncbi:cytochrome P450 [Streptomyces sp. DT24]|uniref:cytochrome P450 n=1 Tax=unclassified Streptomyces TaxID=2593676 RepID=UPI003CFB76CD
MLRGLNNHSQDYWRALAEQPLSRSDTGSWVTARHAAARAVLAEPLLRGQPLLEGIGEIAGTSTETDVAPHAAEAWKRVLHQAAEGQLDVVAVARDAAVGAVAGLWGLSASQTQELAVAVALTDGAVDSSFYPQNLAHTRQIAEGLTALRSLDPIGSSAERLLTAVVGIPMATGLVVHAIAHQSTAKAGPGRTRTWDRLAVEPAYAEPVVSETLRIAAPIQLHATVADAPLDLAGQQIAAGDRVVVVLGAANRDPEVFTAPDRFDPGRPNEQLAATLMPVAPQASVLPFALVCARQGLAQLAARWPQLRPVGPAVRRTAAPVSQSLITYPVSTA